MEKLLKTQYFTKNLPKLQEWEYFTKKEKILIGLSKDCEATGKVFKNFG